MQLKVEEKNTTTKITLRDNEVEIRPREWTISMSDEELCDLVAFLLRRICSEQTASESLSALLCCPDVLYNTVIQPKLNETCPFLSLVIHERRRLGSVVV